MHPVEVVHLEHDGKVLLVDENGNGPQIPIQGRQDDSRPLRLPTSDEIEKLSESEEVLFFLLSFLSFFRFFFKSLSLSIISRSV